MLLLITLLQERTSFTNHSTYPLPPPQGALRRELHQLGESESRTAAGSTRRVATGQGRGIVAFLRCVVAGRPARPVGVTHRLAIAVRRSLSVDSRETPLSLEKGETRHPSSLRNLGGLLLPACQHLGFLKLG